MYAPSCECRHFFLSPGVVMSLSGMIIFFFLWKDIFVQYLKKYHQ